MFTVAAIFSENFDLAQNKIFSLNGINIADPVNQVIGPANGTGTDDVNFSAGDTAYTLGSAVLNSSLTSVGTLTGLTVAGNVLPSGTTRDLGSSTARWANIYSADLQLSNEGKTNDVDGTWGNYTIQEGESELFLINNRNGKKYKFNLTEVS